MIDSDVRISCGKISPNMLYSIWDSKDSYIEFFYAFFSVGFGKRVLRLRGQIFQTEDDGCRTRPVLKRSRFFA